MKNFPSFVVTLGYNKNNENNVTVAFTTALGAIKKGHTVAIMLLVDGVHNAKEGYVDSIDIGAPFSPVKDLMDEYLQNGGMIKVCSACLKHNNISTEKGLLKEAEIINLPDVIDILDNAKTTFQLN